MALNKSMHPRNRYKDKPPDFAHLAAKYPDFQQHVHTSLTGRPVWVPDTNKHNISIILQPKMLHFEPAFLKNGNVLYALFAVQLQEKYNIQSKRQKCKYINKVYN